MIIFLKILTFLLSCAILTITPFTVLIFFDSRDGWQRLIEFFTHASGTHDSCANRVEISWDSKTQRRGRAPAANILARLWGGSGPAGCLCKGGNAGIDSCLGGWLFSPAGHHARSQIWRRLTTLLQPETWSRKVVLQRSNFPLNSLSFP